MEFGQSLAFLFTVRIWDLNKDHYNYKKITNRRAQLQAYIQNACGWIIVSLEVRMRSLKLAKCSSALVAQANRKRPGQSYGYVEVYRSRLMSLLHHSVKLLTFTEYPLDRLQFDLFQRNEAVCPLSMRGLCQHEVIDDMTY